MGYAVLCSATVMPVVDPTHKDGATMAVLFQNGPAYSLVAQVAVHKGDDDGLVRQALALVYIGGQVVRENRRCSLLGQGGRYWSSKSAGVYGGGVVGPPGRCGGT